jgi:hypothetical protein
MLQASGNLSGCLAYWRYVWAGIKNETLKGDEEIRRAKMELEREIKGKYFLFYHL